MDADEIWTSEFDAGGAQLSVGKQILALDGIGTLRQYTLDGQEYSMVQRDVRSFATGNDSAFLILENQTVAKTDDQLNIVFQRMQRGEIGEDIVAVGQVQAKHGLSHGKDTHSFLVKKKPWSWKFIRMRTCFIVES